MFELLSPLFGFIEIIFNIDLSTRIRIEIIKATQETFYMVGMSLLLGSVGGIPLGVFLSMTGKNDIYPLHKWNATVGLLVNITRSIPFIILIIYLFPFTAWIVGKRIGTNATIVPLTIAAIPFIARIVETAIRSIEPGLIEMGRAFGASKLQIIFKILLPEALPTIVQGITLSSISLLGYSAMAGAVGGGGLGQLAYSYGYQRYNIVILNFTVILLIIIVQLFQSTGDKVSKKLDKRKL